MPWKLSVQRVGGVQVRRYSDTEELELGQALLWWARYQEAGEILSLEKVSPAGGRVSNNQDAKEDG